MILIIPVNVVVRTIGIIALVNKRVLGECVEGKIHEYLFSVVR